MSAFVFAPSSQCTGQAVILKTFNASADTLPNFGIITDKVLSCFYLNLRNEHVFFSRKNIRDKKPYKNFH